MGAVWWKGKGRERGGRGGGEGRGRGGKGKGRERGGERKGEGRERGRGGKGGGEGDRRMYNCKNLLSIFTPVAMTTNISPVAVPSTAVIRALIENSRGVFVTMATSSTPSPSPT